MSRDIPAELETEINESVVRPFLALYIALPDPVRAWTGQGTIEFDDSDGNPQEWTGVGTAGAIDVVGEAADGSATGIKATLFQVPSQFREDIADQAVRGAAFEVYVGALDETFQTVEAATLLWKGRLDEYRITDAGDSISVEVTGESRAIDQRRPSIKRFTDEYQQRRHPGDLFFQYVSQMAELPILWAAAAQNSTSTATSTAGGGSAEGPSGGGRQ